MKQRRILRPALSILATSALLLQTAVQAAPPESIQAPGSPFAEPRATPERPPAMAPSSRGEQLYSFKFEGADLDTVMQAYCEWSKKIYLKSDAVTATITVKASSLTKQESIKVVEAILGMNNIALVPMGEKYIKVVQATAPDLGGQGLKIGMDPEQPYGKTDRLVTQIIQLHNVQIPDVQAAVQHLMHAYGKIMALERSNSLMITDTEANIVRIRELIEFIDQASAGIEPRIYNIEHADATEIAAKLSEIISMAQEDQAASTGASVRRSPPGVVRARTTRTPTQPATPTQASFSKTENSGDLIIQGKVKVMADERTNILIIFSQEDNFEFFDKLIQVLDVEVDPAITFEVINLEYADATELAGTLNELVGAVTGSRSGSSGTSRTTSTRTSSIQRANSRVTPNVSPSSAANLSRLSENTKIIADERTNSILLMGEKSDIFALKNVIKNLDIMLEQVIIETAIFEIGLDADLQHGIDWIYKSQDQADGKSKKIGAWDGKNIFTNSLENVVSGAFSYYLNATGINSQFLINLSKTDADARLVSTPVIMTTDNTEAKLSIGEQRPVVTSTDTTLNSVQQRSNYEYKDIGIQLTITPRINPQRVVIMELTQKADSLGGTVDIDGNQVPIIKNREFEATIAVPDGGTVVLGGLISSEEADSVTKIPLLGDIPLIGRYLFSSIHKVDVQRELIVLLTPYVMSTQDEVVEETKRLYKGTNLKPEDWKDSWSESELRFIPDEEEPPMQNTPRAQNTPSANLESQQMETAEKDEMIELLNTMDQ